MNVVPMSKYRQRHRHLQLLRELYGICGSPWQQYECDWNGLAYRKHCPCVCVGCRIYKKPTWISFGLAFPYYILVCWPTVISEATSTTRTHTVIINKNFTFIVARTLVVFPNIALFNSTPNKWVLYNSMREFYFILLSPFPTHISDRAHIPFRVRCACVSCFRNFNYINLQYNYTLNK